MIRSHFTSLELYQMNPAIGCRTFQENWFLSKLTLTPYHWIEHVVKFKFLRLRGREVFLLLKPVKIRVHIGKTSAPLFCPHSRALTLNLPNAVSLLYSSSWGGDPQPYWGHYFLATSFTIPSWLLLWIKICRLYDMQLRRGHNHRWKSLFSCLVGFHRWGKMKSMCSYANWRSLHFVFLINPKPILHENENYHLSCRKYRRSAIPTSLAPLTSIATTFMIYHNACFLWQSQAAVFSEV